MNPELSRRVAKIMHTDLVIELQPDKRIAFVRAVDRADGFDALPKQYQQLIIKAESERTRPQ